MTTFCIAFRVLSFYECGKISRTSTYFRPRSSFGSASLSFWVKSTDAPRRFTKRGALWRGQKSFAFPFCFTRKWTAHPAKNPLETVDYVYCPQHNNLGTIKSAEHNSLIRQTVPKCGNSYVEITTGSSENFGLWLAGKEHLNVPCLQVPSTDFLNQSKVPQPKGRKDCIQAASQRIRGLNLPSIYLSA